MKSIKERRHCAATLLNKKGHHSVAAISSDIDTYTNDKATNVEGTITISDCRRAINISIDAYSKREKSNSLAKLDKMIKILQESRDFLESVDLTYKEKKK